MQDLYNELNNLRSGLNQAIHSLKVQGQKKSKAERDYRIAVAQEILKLRDNKQPVTIINDLVRGTEHIAELKLNRDIAEANYETTMQMIYNYKLNIGIVERQMEATRKGV